jgi:hypothetical protein
MYGGLYRYDPVNGTLGEEVVVGTQLHWCDYVKLIVTIHLPQEIDIDIPGGEGKILVPTDFLMSKSGSGTVTIEVVQWNEYVA